MFAIPQEIEQRRDAYCRETSSEIEELRGYGIDGYVWQTKRDSILKVFRYEEPFRCELAAYKRLAGTTRLQGFHVPALLDYRESFLVLELSYVRPPFVLDFAGAKLDNPQEEFSEDWIREKQSLYGRKWPEVNRLLDALRHLGIYYMDVHLGNIRADD